MFEINICDTYNIFSDICNEFIIKYRDIFNPLYNKNMFMQDTKEIELFIKRMYESNDCDIEDFFDLISVINEVTYRCIENPQSERWQICKMLRIRVIAKKNAKRKYRDYKYKNRKFFNYEEADQQYNEGVEYIWKPSVDKVKLLYETRFPN